MEMRSSNDKVGSFLTCCVILSVAVLYVVSFESVTSTGILSNRGETVRFNCSVEAGSSVDWQFAKTEDSSRINIFFGNARGGGGQKSNAYRSQARYNIEIDIQSGKYDLIIDDVIKADEGFYFCSDVSNPDFTTTTKLTVIEEQDICPNDISAVVGGTVNLTFPAAKKDSIQLKHRSVDRNYPLHVFRDGRLVNDYYVLSGRFTFSASNSSWILKIRNVQSLDAGSFVCSEDNGLGKQYIKELVVMEANGVVCSNDAEENNNEINFTCAANYTGHCPPRLQSTFEENYTGQLRNETLLVTANSVSLSAVVNRNSAPSCYSATQSLFKHAYSGLFKSCVHCYCNTGSQMLCLRSTMVSICCIAIIVFQHYKPDAIGVLSCRAQSRTI